MDEFQFFENWKECRKSADFSNKQDELNTNLKPRTKIINLIHNTDKRSNSLKHLSEKNLKISKTVLNKYKRQNEENTISFQLINIETVEASVNFSLPPSTLYANCPPKNTYHFEQPIFSVLSDSTSTTVVMAEVIIEPPHPLNPNVVEPQHCVKHVKS
jgi:hypothetical protein